MRRLLDFAILFRWDVVLMLGRWCCDFSFLGFCGLLRGLVVSVGCCYEGACVPMLLLGLLAGIYVLLLFVFG